MFCLSFSCFNSIRCRIETWRFLVMTIKFVKVSNITFLKSTISFLPKNQGKTFLQYQFFIWIAAVFIQLWRWLGLVWSLSSIILKLNERFLWLDSVDWKDKENIQLQESFTWRHDRVHVWSTLFQSSCSLGLRFYVHPCSQGHQNSKFSID